MRSTAMRCKSCCAGQLLAPPAASCDSCESLPPLQDDLEKRYGYVVHKLVRRVSSRQQQQLQQVLVPAKPWQAAAPVVAAADRVDAASTLARLAPLTSAYRAFF